MTADAHVYQRWLPFRTLLKREFMRFSEIYVQALVTPIMSAALYLLVFGVSLGSRVELNSDVPYILFVLPGLVAMGVCQSAFSNSSGTIFMARYLNYIVDFLVTPISPAQYIVAYTIAAIARGLLVGVGILGVSLAFVDLDIAHPLQLLGFAVLGSFLFSQIGIIAGIFSGSFDTLAAITNFLILPLIYFSGMFYPISLLPTFWFRVSQLNPMYYLVEGFRGAWLAERAEPLVTCLGLPLVFSGALFLFSAYLIQTGYRTKI
jgi:ABC-2 type transport system permease protein